MKQNKKNAGLRSRNGVTIVEVTIALIIIVIVSAAAVSLMMTSVSVESKFVADTYAEISVENVLECFQFSEDANTFYAALQKLDDYRYDAQQDAYVFTGKSLTVMVRATFSPRRLVYTATSGGEVIFSYTYPVEGGAAG